jgi:prevent-host-death family protein
MRIATISEAKDRLSALIDYVKGGETVVIVDRGRPVARLESAVSTPDGAGRLARLERAGIVRIGAQHPPVALVRRRPPRAAGGVSAVALLLEDRRGGH